MTNLEFIKLLIKSCEEEIDRYTKVKNELYFNDSKNYYEEEIIGKSKEKLNHLQQIKSVLEAWEVVGSKITIEKGMDYSYINIKDWHHQLTKKEVEIIEKALEVEDDKN